MTKLTGKKHRQNLLALMMFACIGSVHAADGPSELTRQIGLEMLRIRMIEQRAEQLRAIDWQPPGYFLVGFTVRVG